MAAGNWLSTWRAYDDDGASDLAAHAGERANGYLGWTVVAVVVAVVLRTVKEHGRSAADRLDPAPPGSAG